MGRRRSLVGALLNELEKSARRADAERRRTNRRVEAARFRSLERELVREERASERQRLVQERELQRLAEQAERERSRRLKLDDKAAQLRAWKAEVEDFGARDEESLRVANDGPEVEDRDGLFAELQQQRAYEPDDFVPPSLPVAVTTEVRASLQVRPAELESFDHPLSTLNAIQGGLGGLALGAGVVSLLPRSPGLALAGAAAAMVGWCLLEAVRASSWATARGHHLAGLERASDERVKAELESRLERFVAKSHEEYRQRVAAEARSHDADQQQRLAHVRELLSGDSSAMTAELQDLLPLELTPEVATSFVVESARKVRLSIGAKLADALQAKSATVLTSGKPSFKTKTQKQLKTEAQRYFSGLALRHASEVMLYLPSVDVVVVEVAMVAVDAAQGVERPQPVLTVSYSFDVLAPLQMEAIDPTEALSHFEHQWSAAPIDSEVKRMVGK